MVGRVCRARRRAGAVDRGREGEAALAAPVEAVGARGLVGQRSEIKGREAGEGRRKIERLGDRPGRRRSGRLRGSDRGRAPHPRRGSERVGDGAPDGPEGLVWLVKTDLGLHRVRVHVDGVIGQFEVEHSDGVTGPIDEVLVGHTHRGGEEAITHIAPVDEGDDLRRGAAREARLSDEPRGRDGA